MSSPPPLPACPNCGRQIAAWKKEHCIYCGTAFPPGFKEGFQEPEALKWVDRPAIPDDAARKLERTGAAKGKRAAKGRTGELGRHTRREIAADVRRRGDLVERRQG